MSWESSVCFKHTAPLNSSQPHLKGSVTSHRWLVASDGAGPWPRPYLPAMAHAHRMPASHSFPPAQNKAAKLSSKTYIWSCLFCMAPHHSQNNIQLLWPDFGSPASLTLPSLPLPLPTPLLSHCLSPLGIYGCAHGPLCLECLRNACGAALSGHLFVQQNVQNTCYVSDTVLDPGTNRHTTRK